VDTDYRDFAQMYGYAPILLGRADIVFFGTNALAYLADGKLKRPKKGLKRPTPRYRYAPNLLGLLKKYFLLVQTR